MQIHLPTIDTSNTDKYLQKHYYYPYMRACKHRSGLCAIIMIIIEEYYYYFACLKFPVVYVMCTWN